MKDVSILIVDDQELIRSSLEVVLGLEKDFQIAGLAEDGELAIAMALEKKPDVILMDVNMPVLNGIEAAKQIKEKVPECFIIILTTFQDMDYVIEALQAGADGYLLKTIDTTDLVSSIRLVAHGGTLITKEVAKVLFKEHIQNKTTAQLDNDAYKLSKREKEILECLANGLSNQDIADKYFLSIGTVKNYISKLYTKLDVANRFEAVQKYRKEHLF